MFDDGAGPALYAAGGFDTRFYGNVRGVGKFSDNAWSTVGEGIGGDVFALAVFDDGGGPALFAANSETDGTGNVFRWTGQSWIGVGSPFNDNARTLGVFDFGEGPRLIAGGDFTKSVGGANLPHIAQLVGFQWKSIGQGFSGPVYAVASYDDGGGPALYAGGLFTKAGNVAANYIARWDGAAWSPVDRGFDDSGVIELAAVTDSSRAGLYASGEFNSGGGILSGRIARLVTCPRPCYADCDQPTGEGVLDLFDFLCYVNRFNAADPEAECTGDSALDLFDFLCFVNAFNAGC